MTKSYHQGGIVDGMSAYASGGVVKAGEGVFTPAQMARMAPSGSQQTNNINVVVNNEGGGARAQVGGGGMTDRDARELSRMIVAVCQQQIDKNRRVGGSSYVSRTERNR